MPHATGSITLVADEQDTSALDADAELVLQEDVRALLERHGIHGQAVTVGD